MIVIVNVVINHVVVLIGLSVVMVIVIKNFPYALAGVVAFGAVAQKRLEQRNMNASGVTARTLAAMSM